MFIPEMNAIHAYNMLEHGLLPNPGTYADQPSTLIEAFDVLDHERSRKMKHDMERKR